jgi:ribonuclease Z
MSLTVTFLGTGGSVPTPDRGLPAVLIQRDGEHFLFDCGEGVQRQMIIGKTGFHKKMKVFITHMHGDHVLGLPGLMQTMALLDRQRKLDVYGPPGIQIFLEAMRESLAFGLTFPVEIHEIEKPGIICEEEEYDVEAVLSDHVVQSFAYAFVEKPRPGRFHPEKAKALNVPEGRLWSKLQHGNSVKVPSGRIVRPEQVADSARAGRKIVYTGDTRPFKSLVTLASNADMLIHDGTLDDDLAERAALDGHSTPSQAASTAKKAKVKQLVLTHISARYSDASILMKQAKKTFRKTLVAKDFMKMDVPSPRI